MNIVDLPFSRLIGLQRRTSADSSVSLPAGECYTNHLGTVHAAALFAVAEAASGEFLLQEFPHLEGRVIPMVRRAEVKYRQPARGAVHARAHVAPETRAAFVSALEQKRRALITIAVAVFDEHGTRALDTSIEWFVAFDRAAQGTASSDQVPGSPRPPSPCAR